MIFLYPTQILYLHKRIAAAIGGSPHVRDVGLLESAVYRPMASFGGADLYPDVYSKAGALGHSLISNHPFVDGNKRTGYEAMRLMLRLNGLDVRAGEDDAFRFVMDLAEKKLDEHGAAAWLKSRSARAA